MKFQPPRHFFKALHKHQLQIFGWTTAILVLSVIAASVWLLFTPAAAIKTAALSVPSTELNQTTVSTLLKHFQNRPSVDVGNLVSPFHMAVVDNESPTR